jgi:mRNA m6A methyltransferase catalytic subunit
LPSSVSLIILSIVASGVMVPGNQLSGVRLVDESLLARFKATYPDVEVQPASPL